MRVGIETYMSVKKLSTIHITETIISLFIRHYILHLKAKKYRKVYMSCYFILFTDSEDILFRHTTICSTKQSPYKVLSEH